MQTRHLPFALEAMKFRDEPIRAKLIGVIHVEAAEPRIEMILQRGDAGGAGVVGRLAVADKFAVAAVADAGLPGTIPEVAAGGRGEVEVAFGGVRILLVLVVAVGQRPGFFDEVAGIGTHRPFVPVGADFALDVEIIEQDELAGQFMVVRRDALGKKTERRIAIALRKIPENLIVGPVLFDDVEAILDRRRTAEAARNGMTFLITGGDNVRLGRRQAAIHLRGVLLHLIGKFLTARQVDHADGALHETGDVFAHGGGRFLTRLRAVAIGFADESLAIG